MSVINGTYTVNGYVQKGPFIAGTTITIQELDSNFAPTGTTYSTTTEDDTGSFSITSTLSSYYIEIIASGYYYNEISGSISESTLTLRNITDLRNGEEVNINLLTSMETERIKYLVQEGLSFQDARAQAETEILDIFNIKPSYIEDMPDMYFELMDLTQPDDSGAALLAISAILQSDNSVGELSEMISKIILDIKEDGTLDNETYLQEIQDSYDLIDSETIKTNITARYEELGISSSIPDFELYLDDDSDGIINKYENNLYFQGVYYAELNTSYTSNEITLILQPEYSEEGKTITIDNGSLVINGTDTGSKSQVVFNGDTIAIKLTSSSELATSVISTITMEDGNTGQFAIITTNICGFAGYDSEGAYCNLIQGMHDYCFFDGMGFTEAELGEIANTMNIIWQVVVDEMTSTTFDDTAVKNAFDTALGDSLYREFYQKVIGLSITNGNFSFFFLEASLETLFIDLLLTPITLFMIQMYDNNDCSVWHDAYDLIHEITDCTCGSTCEGSGYWDMINQYSGIIGLTENDACVIFQGSMDNLDNSLKYSDLINAMGPSCDNTDYSSVGAPANMETLFTYLTTDGETPSDIETLAGNLLDTEIPIIYNNFVDALKDFHDTSSDLSLINGSLLTLPSLLTGLMISQCP